MAEDAKQADKPLPPIAGKSRDLEALRNAAVDAANVSGALWFSYLFGLLYFVIAVGSVTHRNLLFENPIKLPFLNVDLPLVGFFVLGPAVFLIVHAYTLLHFAMLADKVGVFHAELQAQIPDEAIRASLRRQLPSNIFVQFLAGPREVREGLMGVMLRLIAEISLVVGPIALLVFFLIQFLPYHHEVITWWHRIAVVIDLALLWALWPSVARGETARIGWRDFRRTGVIAATAASLVPVVLVFAIATFQGEWLHRNSLSVPFIPNYNEGSLSWTTPHKFLVAGDVDLVARKQSSLWSNRLVLPNLEQPPANFSARGRQLERAVFLSASLQGVDFSAAELQGAIFNEANLREAKFTCIETQAKVDLDAGGSKPGAQKTEKPEQRCAQLQNASLQNAQLERANFAGASMQGASLRNANLQGASLIDAVLPEANLNQAKLQGAVLNGADLSGADMERAQLQGASLKGATLAGAYLRYAQLQGVVGDKAKLSGAILRQAQLQGASFYQADFTAVTFEEAHAQAASFEKSKFDAAMFVNAQFQGASFFDASFNGAWFSRGVGAMAQPAQLQGVDFDSADLEAAYFNTPPVWRSNARDLRPSENAFVHEPVTAQKSYGVGCRDRGICDFSPESFAALKQAVETRVPAGRYRDEALARIAILDPGKPANDEREMANAWSALAAQAKPSAGDFDRILAKLYREIGCDEKNTVHALRRIIAGVLATFDGGNEALSELLEAFDRDPKCANARALTARDREILATMYDAAKKMRDPPVAPKQ